MQLYFDEIRNVKDKYTMKNPKIILTIIAIIIFSTVGVLVYTLSNQGQDSDSNSDSNSKENLTVSVSILPQEYFVEKVGGDKVQVSAMIPPGASPATYEPTPSDLANLENSEIYFRF